MALRDADVSVYVRAVLIIAASTVALTAAFVGVVAVATRGAAGFGDRFPFYVLAMAIAFVTSLLILDDQDIAGWSVIGATVGIALTTLVVVSLGFEGVTFVIERREEMVGPVLAYFVSAGLICTGLTYWGLNHWREFTGTGTGGGLKNV